MSPGISKRLVASYISDWVVLGIIGVITYIFNRLTPHPHAFSLLDLSISYPLNPDTVPFWVAAIIAGPVPALIIVIVVFAVVPSRTVRRASSRRRILHIRLWEWHAAWFGLAMSLAVAAMITAGLKNFGKPRPNCLARCQPDLSDVTPNVVGGDGQDISPRWALVTAAICTQKDIAILNDAFQSWPSGHSSYSWAGLFYLTLFLAAKFSIRLPQLPMPSSVRGSTTNPASRAETTDSPGDQRPILNSREQDNFSSDDAIAYRDEAAGPPAYLIFAILVPCGGALYIAVSRWMDYAHHGFDVISGSLIGIACAYVSFRWYNPPFGTGAGWAWGPRSPARAFEIGVGTDGFVEGVKDRRSQDVELGRLHVGD